MPYARARRLTVAAAAVGCLAAATAPALAEPSVSGSPGSTVVSTAVGAPSSRQLTLRDLTGAPLTALPLRPGVPSPFRVEVKDTGVNQLTSASSGFTVSSVLNNLYLDGDPTKAFIPSSQVAVSFPAGGAQDATGSLLALPRTVLSGNLPGCSTLFSTVSSITSLSILSGAGLNLCNAVGSTGLTVPATEVVTSTTKSLADLAEVPFTLAGQESGAYTTADYLTGIGAADTRGSGAGTPRTMLTGVPNISTALQTKLDTLTSGMTALPEASATGAGAQTAVSDVIGTFLTVPALAPLGNALAGLTPTQASDVVNVLTGVVQQLGLGDIVSATGLYNSFPVLTATPAGSTAQGAYSGTLTVTLVQP